MKLFPVRSYTLVTKLNLKEIGQRLLEKDAKDNYFDVGLSSEQEDSLVFDASFYKHSYRYNGFHDSVNQTLCADHFGSVVFKKDHSQISVTTKMAMDQKSVLGIIWGFLIFFLILVVYALINNPADSINAMICGGIFIVLILLSYLISVGIIQESTNHSKRFFIKLLDAKEHR